MTRRQPKRQASEVDCERASVTVYDKVADDCVPPSLRPRCSELIDFLDGDKTGSVGVELFDDGLEVHEIDILKRP